MKNLLYRLIEPHSGILFRARGGLTDEPVNLTKLRESDIDGRTSPVYQNKQELYRARLSSGHVHLGVKDGGRVVHYLWASPPGTEVRMLWGLNYAVAKNEWYVWDVLTDPDFRNRGMMQKALRSFRSQVPADENLVVAVYSGNAPSIAAIQRAGFKVLRTYYGVLLFRRLSIVRYASEFRIGFGRF